MFPQKISKQQQANVTLSSYRYNLTTSFGLALRMPLNKASMPILLLNRTSA
jgi:hypothetical protein